MESRAERLDAEVVELGIHRYEEATMAGIAACLKAVQRLLGRAQTLANGNGDFRLGAELKSVRGHAGRVQRDYNVDVDRVKGPDVDAINRALRLGATKRVDGDDGDDLQAEVPLSETVGAQV